MSNLQTEISTRQLTLTWLFFGTRFTPTKWESLFAHAAISGPRELVFAFLEVGGVDNSVRVRMHPCSDSRYPHAVSAFLSFCASLCDLASFCWLLVRFC